MRAAIDAAHAAKSSWGNSPAALREKILHRAADELEAATSEMVDLLIGEGGSTFGKLISKSPSPRTCSARLPEKPAACKATFFLPTSPAFSPSRSAARSVSTPASRPSIFPVVLALKKVAFALATGNTFVLKPSEETSLVGLKLAEIFERAGLPPGVLNVVPGDGPTLGRVLFDDPRVKLISFTGSTAVGRHIAVECAKKGKRVVLEWAARAR